MATNSSISVTEGTGKNIATYSISETSTKELQRVVNSDSTGVEAVTPGVAANHLGKAEDAAHTSGDTGVFVLAVRNDAAATVFSGTNGDYTPVAVTANGTVLNAEGVVEDSVHASGDRGTFAMGTRQDTPTATAGTSGDYQGAAYSAQGSEWVTLTPSTTGGWSPKFISALTNSPSSVKVSAGTLGGWYIFNPNASPIYVQIFDSGSIVLGSTVPVLSLGIPASAGANVEFANGINFATAIAVAATTTSGGSTAPSTAVAANFLYK